MLPDMNYEAEGFRKIATMDKLATRAKEVGCTFDLVCFQRARLNDYRWYLYLKETFGSFIHVGQLIFEPKIGEIAGVRLSIPASEARLPTMRLQL
ncbi:hypothetical protein F441_11411 [Phytophthora nicotianae CJ01A1]|nr:hypothetical protein F441_11411 [Phytophthora nicotianae CJ01A1]